MRAGQLVRAPQIRDTSKMGVPVQTVRLLDVVALGPVMIWFGARCSNASPMARGAMVAAGVGTIAYNYQRWKAAAR